jgi:RNA-directed DNA polymerase
LVVAGKKWDNLKGKLKEITRKTSGSSFDARIRRLKEVYRGWINYFGMASITGKLNELDGWLRNRLRYCIWHDWKKPERKRKNLIRLGVEIGLARAWSRTRKGGWAVAQSPILGTTITLKKLKKRGYESMLDYYQKISPQFNEPLYTRPAWPALRNEGYSGVRGAPRQLQLARPSTRLVVRFFLWCIIRYKLFFF